jgi:outer membrane protein OmpA-like peptidoglycan-associated protein
VRAAAGVIERQLAPSDGSLNLRLGNDGRIEFLIGTPDLPVTGRLGVGFRCQNGRCQPVGAKDPADISERTYTLQEAIDMLKKPREAPGAPSEPTPLAPICSPDRQIPLFNACCPPGLVWNGSACAPLSPCLPGQMSPGGICCPPGQQWDFITHRCDLAHPSEQASAPSSQFTLPQLQLGATPLRFGMIESATFDNFRVDDATAPSQHDAALDNLVSLLNIYREVEVHIEGHTDSSASEAHNDRLSVARAEGIRAALAARQVANPGRFRIQGFGERQLRFQPERTEADKAGNRRVEVWFHIPPSRGLGEELRLRPTL